MTRNELRARPVGTLQLLALGVNGIVGVGIFFVPASMARSAPGVGLVVVFALTGLALLPAALAFATLGARFDEDGGPVVYARAAFGEDVSALVGWVTYVSGFFSTAAVLVGLTQLLEPALGLEGTLTTGPLVDEGRRLTLSGRAVALALLALLALVVASGLRLSARVWTAMTVLKLSPLLLLLAAGLARTGPVVAPPSAPADLGWLRAGLTAVFACQGFEIVPVIAGQVRSPDRAVPRATVGSLVLAVVLYVALAGICVSVLPDVAASPAPLADAANLLGGGGLAELVAWGMRLSALGITFGMLVTTPHYLSALAAGERGLLGLDRLSADRVPRRALAATVLLVALFVAFGELGELFALSSLGVLMQYGVTAAALLALARRRERGLRPGDAWPAPLTLGIATALAGLGATAREGMVALAVVGSGMVALHLARRARHSSSKS